MAKRGKTNVSDDSLRRQAEMRLNEAEDHGIAPNPENAQRLLHELRVHQIELKTQNEELRRTQEDAESALKKYTDLYDFAPVGYLTLDRDGTILSVNFIGASLLGGERDRLIGCPFGFFVTEKTRPALNAFLVRAFSGTAGGSCELALPKEGEALRDVRITATVSTTGQECRMIVVDITRAKNEENILQNSHDQLEKVVAERTADLVESNIRLQRDIAERMQVEKALRDSEERYRHLLSSITSYVYRVDVADGVVSHTEHGDGCQAVTGYTWEDYEGNVSLWIAMIPEEDRPVVLEAMARILTSHDPIAIEHRIVRQDGGVRWIRNTLVPHCDATGALRTYDGVIADITERKRYETKQIQMERESHQNEKLRALGQLAAGVAHEVRNPLNAMVVTVELLAEQLSGNREYQPNLDRIRRQVNRLDNLMKDLLELRRPEDSRNRQLCKVSVLCRMAIDIWKQSNKMLRHDLTTELAPEADHVEVFVDPERVTQVIINLLDNAAQHSLVETEIRVLAKGAVQGFASICVMDEGQGFSEKALAAAFDPFFTTRKGGSGLGLSIAKHIIEIYSGQMSIRNHMPLPGCTVEIRLPVVTELPE